MATTTYCTPDQVKAELGEDAGISNLDTTLDRIIAAASRQIDTRTGRKGTGFWTPDAVSARVFTADDSYCIDVDDFSTTTGLIVKTDTAGLGTYSTTLTINTGFIVTPPNAAALTPASPYTGLRFINSGYAPISSYGIPGVQVTALWGWAAVPDEVIQACVIQSVRLFKASPSIYGSLQLASGGASLSAGAPLHPDAEALIAEYVKQ